jgi:hypothetical protein
MATSFMWTVASSPPCENEEAEEQTEVEVTHVGIQTPWKIGFERIPAGFRDDEFRKSNPSGGVLFNASQWMR